MAPWLTQHMEVRAEPGTLWTGAVAGKCHGRQEGFALWRHVSHGQAHGSWGSSVGVGSLRCSQVFRLQADFDEFVSPNSLVWDLYFMGLEPVVNGEWKFKSSLSDNPAPTSQSPAGHPNSARLDHSPQSPRETLSEL